MAEAPIAPVTVPDWPIPPSAADPSNFEERADTFLGSFPDQTDALNDAVENVNHNAQVSYDNAVEAQGFRDESEGFRDEAEEFAATAVNAPGTKATSSTNLTIGSGIKNFGLVETGKLFEDGMNLIFAVPGNSGNRMLGRLNNFNSATGAGELHVIEAQGAGTFSNWVVSMAPINSLGDSITVSQATPINAVEGDCLILNTGTDAAVVTLPANPDGRGPITVVRPNGAAGANSITLDRNGKTIRGVAENYVLDLPGYAVQLIWVGTTYGVLGPFPYNQS